MTPIQININGTWIQNSIPELHAALRRPITDGQGVFETMRMVDGTVPLLERHYHRLKHSIAALGFQIPDLPEPDRILAEIKNQPLNEPHPITAKLRWGAIWNSKTFQQQVNYALPSWFIEVIPTPDYAQFDANPLIVGVFTEKRKQSGANSVHKLMHEQLYEESSQFALKNEWDESLILNTTGQIIESETSNLFVWDGNRLVTPPLLSGCVGGIYRTHVIEVCKKSGIPVIESAVQPESLQEASEIILCNALRGVRAVKHFSGKEYGTAFSRTLFALCRKAEQV